MMNSQGSVPIGVKALSLFFFLATGIALASLISLLNPGNILEEMWIVNPRAHAQFVGMGTWAIVLLGILALVCSATGIGLWTRRLWGFKLAVGVLSVNLLGDLTNAIVEGEPRTLFGVPIVAGILVYLFLRHVRETFRSGSSS
jgi:hypothetical protein